MGGSPDVKLTERDEQCKGIYERGKDQKQATAEPAKTLICLISRAYIVPTRKKMGYSRLLIYDFSYYFPSLLSSIKSITAIRNLKTHKVANTPSNS
jgi:hypothetical protein